MKRSSVVKMLAVRILPATLLLLAGMLAARSAWSAQPRPWLCRQIPVFSGTTPMTWRATSRGTGSWLMIFMRYDPAGGHDGFTIVSTQRVKSQTEGSLDAGQWYAVAQYSAGGHWICPANARESHDSAAGSISSLCYGEDEDACDVKLVVKSAGAPSVSTAP
jgi:hypothetical protein